MAARPRTSWPGGPGAGETSVGVSPGHAHIRHIHCGQEPADGPAWPPQRHRHCPGPWHGEITTGYTGDGKRARRKVSGKTKAAVIDKFRDLRIQLDNGITPKAGYAHYTVRQAAGDWLAHGLDGRSPKTITKNQNVLEPILKIIGARKLRELAAADVRQALAAMAAGYSSAAVTIGHLTLKRAIRHAEANDLVVRNVAILADTPKGQEGRPSKSLTLDQAVAVITTARTLPVMELRPGLKDVRRPAALMHAYITHRPGRRTACRPRTQRPPWPSHRRKPQRRHREDQLTGHIQAFPASGQEPHPPALGKQRGHQARRRLQDVLAVIQHHQQLTAGQRAHQPRGRGRHIPFGHTQGLRDAGRDQRRIGERGKLDQPGAVAEAGLGKRRHP